MIHRKELTEEEVKYVIENNEFADSVIGNKKTIVVLSQSWCPQWLYLKKWIFDIKTEDEVYMYELEYDRKKFFRKFMAFKERVWKNYEVPYIRYYINGSLIAETNYTNENRIRKIMSI